MIEVTFTFKLLGLDPCNLLATHASRGLAPRSAGLDGVELEVVS